MNAKQMMRTVVYIGYIIVYNLIFFLKGQTVPQQDGSRMDLCGWQSWFPT